MITFLIIIIVLLWTLGSVVMACFVIDNYHDERIPFIRGWCNIFFWPFTIIAAIALYAFHVLNEVVKERRS